MHLNIQSIRPDLKKLQLDSIKTKHNPDFISLNETFLKPSDEFELDGYNTLRSDRTTQKGGGTALCIKQNIKGTEIKINSQGNSYIVGFLMSATKNKKIAIFSIYVTPQKSLKKELLDQITQNYEKFYNIRRSQRKKQNLALSKHKSKRNISRKNRPRRKPTYFE